MRVAIIGGGMAGLSAAHELLRLGHDAAVFEAAERAGGKVGSMHERGWLTEDGPSFISQPLDALLEAARLRGELVEPAPPMSRWVYLRGELVEAPSMPLLCKAGLGRALLEPLLRRPLRGDVPLEQFLEQRLGPKAGRLAASVMAAGVYAGDPARLSARDAFPMLAQDGSLLWRVVRGTRRRRRLWTLRAGLGALPHRLAAALGTRVRLRAAVTRLAPQWDVNGEHFDAVILALPAAAAAELTSSFAPEFAAIASRTKAAPVTVVHLGYPEGELPRGFGAIDADGSLHAIGTVLVSSMVPGRAPAGKALATAICGGARHPERAALPDAALIEIVAAELRALFGVRSRPEYARIVRWASAIPQPEPGHLDRVRAARAALRALPRIEVAGASWDGVSVPDVVRSGADAAWRLAAS